MPKGLIIEEIKEGFDNTKYTLTNVNQIEDDLNANLDNENFNLNTTISKLQCTCLPYVFVFIKFK